MTEKKFTFCDFCNPLCKILDRHGRGYMEFPRSEIENFGWVRIGDKDKCQQCQEEEEKHAEALNAEAKS